MIKSLFAIPAILMMASPAVAEVQRGEPFAVRACGDAFSERTDVCYGQRTTGSVFPFSRGVGIEVDRYRTVRVRCDQPQITGTVRGDVAARYCLSAADGSLAPASFLQ